MNFLFSYSLTLFQNIIFLPKFIPLLFTLIKLAEGSLITSVSYFEGTNFFSVLYVVSTPEVAAKPTPPNNAVP